jgi:tetratricopeptide (TPR) repeat protein
MITISKSAFLLVFILFVSACNQKTERVIPDKGRHVLQFARAKAAFEKGDHDEAIAIHTKIIELDPENAFAYTKRGYSHYKLGEDQQAINDYNKAIELNPDYAETYALRGLAYAFLQQQEQAINDCRKAIELNPDLAEAYLGLGRAYNFAEQYQQAIDNYNKAIELNPNEDGAYTWRGLVYNTLGDYQQALADYNRAIELAPIASNYNNRAFIYDNLGHYDQAIADFKKATELNPDFALGYANLGLAYTSMWDFKKAEESCQKSLRLDENNCAAHYCLGIVYKELGGYENSLKAIEYYKKAAELDCYYFEKGNVANAYIHQGLIKALNHLSPEEIRADYKKAIQLDPQHTYGYFLLGEQSDDEEAIAYYSKAIELTPDYSVPYLKRGLIYKQQGKIQEAAADFEHAKKRAIDPKWLHEAEEQLRLLTSLSSPTLAPSPTLSLPPVSMPSSMSRPQEQEEEAP